MKNYKYVVFSFVCFFLFVQNSFATKYCTYQNDKLSGDKGVYQLSDSSGEISLKRITDNSGAYKNENVKSSIDFQSFDECPKKIYYSDSGNGKWSTSSSGATNTYSYVDTLTCTYKPGYDNYTIELDSTINFIISERFFLKADKIQQPNKNNLNIGYYINYLIREDFLNQDGNFACPSACMTMYSQGGGFYDVYLISKNSNEWGNYSCFEDAKWDFYQSSVEVESNESVVSRYCADDCKSIQNTDANKACKNTCNAKANFCLSMCEGKTGNQLYSCIKMCDKGTTDENNDSGDIIPESKVCKLGESSFKVYPAEKKFDYLDMNSNNCFSLEYSDDITFDAIFHDNECTKNKVCVETQTSYSETSNKNITSCYVYLCGKDYEYKDEEYDEYEPVCGVFKSEDAGGKLLSIIKNLYKILKIAIPVLVIILTIVEFLKVLFSGEEKTMKDAFKATTTRFILIAVLIFLPIIIEFVIKITGMSENCLQHFL